MKTAAIIRCCAVAATAYLLAACSTRANYTVQCVYRHKTYWIGFADYDVRARSTARAILKVFPTALDGEHSVKCKAEQTSRD